MNVALFRVVDNKPKFYLIADKVPNFEFEHAADGICARKEGVPHMMWHVTKNRFDLPDSIIITALRIQLEQILCETD